MLLNIKNLHVSIGGKEILKGLNLGVNEGEIHAIMGPNGTGKSTLAAAITGREGYEITEGEIWYKGKNTRDRQSHRSVREPDPRFGRFASYRFLDHPPLCIPATWR